MKANIGMVDMGVRLFVAAVLLFAGLLPAMLAADAVTQSVLLSAGVVALITATSRFCPLYLLLGINTTRSDC